MPMTKDGKTRADIIQDPASTISRMNIGRLYEQYISKCSRQVKEYIIDELLNIDELDDLDSTIDVISADIIDSLFNRVVNFLGYIDTEQFTAYNNITKSADKREILKEIVNKELYVYYSVGSKKQAWKIVEDLKVSEFKADISPILFKNAEGVMVESKEDILIGPMYTILLAKIADTWLSTSGAKVNHFGLPTSISKNEKNRLPWRNSATKVLSETESRLYTSYCGEEFLAELKDRGTSIPAHEHTYRTILDADQPTNIERVVDRTKVPYGEDKAREVVDALLGCAGLEIAYGKDENIMHPKQS